MTYHHGISVTERRWGGGWGCSFAKLSCSCLKVPGSNQQSVVSNNIFGNSLVWNFFFWAPTATIMQQPLHMFFVFFFFYMTEQNSLFFWHKIPTSAICMVLICYPVISGFPLGVIQCIIPWRHPQKYSIYIQTFNCHVKALYDKEEVLITTWTFYVYQFGNVPPPPLQYPLISNASY